jgi:hypothetical protein
MGTILRMFYRLVTVTQRFANVCWSIPLVLSLALLLLSNWVTADGGDTFAWLRKATGEETWTEALSAGLFIAFEFTAAAAIIVTVVRFVLRSLLLLDGHAATGTILSVRQTGGRINQRPIMALRIRVDTPNGPIAVSLSKLIDLGNIPRKGDRAKLWVSRIDPTCIAYHGLA